MSKLLKKSVKDEPVMAPEPDSATSQTTAVAYMRVLKDYSLLMEYKRLKQQSPTGVYVLPAADSLRRWYGVIFVRKGHYRGGVFKFVIIIPPNYPDEGPRVHFLSEVFHPLIHPDTGLLDLSLQFPQWNSTQHYIVLVLCYIKKIFYKTEYWDGRPGKEAMNPKAQNLWIRSKDDYLKLCEQNCSKSTSAEKLYSNSEDPLNSLVFERPRPAHDEAHRRIVRQDKERGLAGESYREWFSDGVYRLDNALGPQPTALPSAAFQAPQPVTLSAAAATASVQLLGLMQMSPISPLVKMHERTASELEAEKAAAEVAAPGEEEEGSTLTVAQLASIA